MATNSSAAVPKRFGSTPHDTSGERSTQSSGIHAYALLYVHPPWPEKSNNPNREHTFKYYEVFGNTVVVHIQLKQGQLDSDVGIYLQASGSEPESDRLQLSGMDSPNAPSTATFSASSARTTPPPPPRSTQLDARHNATPARDDALARARGGGGGGAAAAAAGPPRAPLWRETAPRSEGGHR